MTKETPPIIKDIKNYWMIILFIGGLIVGWTTINTRLSQAENRVEQLSKVVTEINQINITLTKLDKDVEYIKLILKQTH